MNQLTIPATAFVLLASMGLSVAQAAPSYMQVDCIVRDGGPGGCWSVGSNGDLIFMALDNEQASATKVAARTKRTMKKSSRFAAAGMHHTINPNANTTKDAPIQEIPDRDSGVLE
jgi:hypothetical protein